MIITIMPENDIERAKMEGVTHTGVNEFFLFGNKKYNENELMDFHDWSGSYVYLVGKLNYFTGMLTGEQLGKSSNKPTENEPTEIKITEVPKEDLKQESKESKLIKRGGPQDGKIEGLVEVQNAKVGTNDTKLRVVGLNEDEENPEDEEIPEEGNDNSKGAEE